MILALNHFVVGLLVVFFLLISALLILIVLIQRPQGGGLSEAFGSSSGSGATAFGAKTGDALTTATIGVFVLFLVTAVGLNYFVRPYAPPPDQPAATPANGTGAPATPAGTTPTEGRMEIPLTPVEGPPPGFPAGTTGTTTDDTQSQQTTEDAPATTTDEPAPADEPGTTPEQPQDDPDGNPG